MSRLVKLLIIIKTFFLALGNTRPRLLSLRDSRGDWKGKLRPGDTRAGPQDKSVRGNQNYSQQEAFPSSSARRGAHSR